MKLRPTIALASLLAAASASADVDILTATACGQIVANSVTNRIYSRCGPDLVEIDGATHAQRSLALDRPIVGVDPVGNRVVASNASGITIVDVPTWTSTSYPASTAGPLALDPENGVAWIAQASGTALRFDLGTGTTTPFPLGSGSTYATITIDPLNDLVYVILSPLNRIVELDTTTGTTRFADVGAPVTGIGQSAIDPLRRELYVSSSASSPVFGSGPAITVVDTVTMTVTLPTGVGDENPFLFATDPGNDRLWTGFGQNIGCAGVIAGLGSVSGCRSFPGQWTVNPATSRAYVGYYDFAPDPIGAGLVERDFDPLTPEVDLPLPSGQSGQPAVVLSTNRVYIAHSSLFGGIIAIREHDEAEAVPVPLPVEITHDPVQPNGSVTLHFSATSGWPTPLPIQQIYYQLDSVDGAWTRATPAGATGSATLTLAPGIHTVHAFAADGQEATIGRIQEINPVTGPVASLEITIPSPTACSNGIDDDGDSLTDYPADPGCRTASNTSESPQCDNGVDDDGDLAVDHPADSLCRARWDNDEASNPGGCGIGAEIALALALLRRARPRSRA